MGVEGLLANVLALPATLADQQQQNELMRRALGPQYDANGQTAPGIFTPEQLQLLAPDVGQFPGMKVPVLGTILKGVGEFGQLAQAAMGGAPDAPRIPAGTLVQIQNLREKQARQRGMLNLISSVPQDKQALYKQLVEGGDTDTALKLLGIGAGGRPSQTALLEERATLQQQEADGQLSPVGAQRLKVLNRFVEGLTGVAGSRAAATGAASLQFAGPRAEASAEASELVRGRRRDQEKLEQRQRLNDFRNANPPPGAGGPAGVVPKPGMNPVSLLSGTDPMSADVFGVQPAAATDVPPGTDALAATEVSRTDSPESLSVTRVTPILRQQAVKALREAKQPPQNPDGTYSEAQIQQYLNAVAGSGVQAEKLGGLTPEVVAAEADRARALGDVNPPITNDALMVRSLGMDPAKPLTPAQSAQVLKARQEYDQAQHEAQKQIDANFAQLTNEDRNVITGFLTTQRLTERLLSEFSPEELQAYTGIIANPLRRAAQLVSPDPRFAKFNSLIGMIERSKFSLTGAALTDTENAIVNKSIITAQEIGGATDLIAKAKEYLQAAPLMVNTRLGLIRPVEELRQDAAAQRGVFAPTAGAAPAGDDVDAAMRRLGLQ